MPRKLQLRPAAALAVVLLAVLWSPVRADEIPIVTGEQWTTSSEQIKRAYLIGVANIVQIDAAYQKQHASVDNHSVIPRLARGLNGQTLDTIREELDGWYARHPDQLQRPVLETVWFEMVGTGLQQDR